MFAKGTSISCNSTCYHLTAGQGKPCEEANSPCLGCLELPHGNRELKRTTWVLLQPGWWAETSSDSVIWIISALRPTSANGWNLWPGEATLEYVFSKDQLLGCLPLAQLWHYTFRSQCCRQEKGEGRLKGPIGSFHGHLQGTAGTVCFGAREAGLHFITWACWLRETQNAFPTGGMCLGILPAVELLMSNRNKLTGPWTSSSFTSYVFLRSFQENNIHFLLFVLLHLPIHKQCSAMSG